MTEARRGSIEMIAAMTIAGTIGWLAVESGLPPATMVFWRCLFALPCLGLLSFKNGAFSPMRARELFLAIFGGVAIVVNWVLLFAAFPRASISVATIVYNSQPFMLVGLAAIFLHERVSWSKVAWLWLAFGGLVLILVSGPPRNLATSNFVLGIAFSLAAASAWAVAALTTRALRGRVAPELVAMIHMIVGIVLLAPFAAPSSIDGHQWAFLAVMGVIHTGLVYALMYRAVQTLPPYLQGTLTYIYPVVALAVDLIAFHRALSATQLAGLAAILVAALMTSVGTERLILPLRSRILAVVKPVGG